MSILISCDIKQLLFVNILKFVKFSQYYALNFVCCIKIMHRLIILI